MPLEHENGQTHGWYHAIRETLGDVAAMAVVLFIFFGNRQYQNSATWRICLVVLVGYYAPYWVGLPFNKELGAPNLGAEFSHVLQAVAAMTGLFLARREFLFTDS